MPNAQANIIAANQLRNEGYLGSMVAVAKFEDEVTSLKAAGINEVYNIYAEAGSGAASKMQSLLRR
jgi:hypothetical protein